MFLPQRGPEHHFSNINMEPGYFPEDLAEWDISKTYGLLFEEPLEFLPDYFSPWNTLAKSVPSLVKSRKLREAVHETPLLDAERLVDDKELRLAHIQLSFIASGYVWQDGDKGVSKVLPRPIAVPLYSVAQILNCLPVVNHTALALANWKKLDKHGSNTADNLKPMYCLPGGEDAEWFIAVVLEMEVAVAPVWQAIPEVIKAVTRRDEGAVCDNLDVISRGLRDAQECFGRIHDKVAPKVFFEDVRPFIFGWGWPGSPLSDGLIYEGVSETPIKAPAGGTTMFLRPIDSLLGVEKSEKSSNFHSQDAVHFPDNFRKYLNAIQNHANVRDFVNERRSEKVTEAYNQAVSAVAAFRTYHLGVVTRFAIQQTEKGDTSKKYVSTFKLSSAGKEIHPTLYGLCEDTTNTFL